MRSLTDSQLADQTLRFRDILIKNAHRIDDALNELLPEAFATVREASRRVLGMRHFDSQLVGKARHVVCTWPIGCIVKHNTGTKPYICVL